ncbi:MAG: hypothetical protein OFPII_42290 [Osedax symbiont Rs1]|nr:MAG: hypothetical protein OFPII_42290 [Osedax symbiont Rs1]
MPAEPTGAAKIFQFHCKTNILHSVFTLKSRIQDGLNHELHCALEVCGLISISLANHLSNPSFNKALPD